MEFEFWGTRGSSATPDADKIRYGGNTSSVVLQSRALPGHYFLFDAGTGLARFGGTLNPAEGHTATLMLCHLHLYHILGFQFTPLVFAKAYQTTVIGPNTPNFALESVFDYIMTSPYSPVYGLENLVAKVNFQEVSAEARQVGPIEISPLALPRDTQDESWAYRLSDGHKGVAYIADAPIRGGDGELYPALLPWLGGVQVLIAAAFDPHYERRNRTTYADIIELAQAAGIKRVYFCHHHPHASDAHLDQVQAEARAAHPDLEITIAAEGMRVGV
jgi:ribonuclease BN (tRNA processing enzyme)